MYQNIWSIQMKKIIDSMDDRDFSNFAEYRFGIILHFFHFFVDIWNKLENFHFSMKFSIHFDLSELIP